MNTDNPTRYTHTAIALHWLMAPILMGIFILGMYMSDLPKGDFKSMLYGYHKSVGIVVLLLVSIRMVWRITHRPPALLPGMPAWQEKAAHALHHSLYLLMFIVPITGWLMSSAKGHPVVLFDAIPLPDLIGKNHDLGELFEGIHEVCNYLICTLFFVHVLAAYKHHLIDHDGTLARMLPFLAKK